MLGGTGWVGRHIVDALRARGDHVLVVARHRAPHVPEGMFRAFDLATATPGTIADLLRRTRAGVVINATDGANTNDGWDRPESALARVNVHAVHCLLAGIGLLRRRPRLVQIGTIHEYGPVAPGTLIDETVPPRPSSAYAATKLAGSTAVLEAARSGAVDGLVLRLANVCGPHPSPASFPGKLLRLVLSAGAGAEVTLPLAAASRDFIDVRDVAVASLRAADAGVTGRALNIGSGVAVEIRDFVARFLAVAGLRPGALNEEQLPVPSMGGDWVRTDIRLAEQLLGWRPQIGLEDSLREMWEAARPGSHTEVRPSARRAGR
ncbi:NAD-dependent epimerase/dehydratase family protein [Streptomyces bugieae]|uniref:NAD(P)-dependent oxidoreductase n=1 Tax=Streptomyces bugieae TaxID=3098223 RepID=A0ABU7NZ50_9ACTN|nr:NAD(P)-dependent oxidoreductase [Streptomyces sp. DSM 41528]